MIELVAIIALAVCVIVIIMVIRIYKQSPKLNEDEDDFF
jgi:uncharacterized protein YoxC